MELGFSHYQSCQKTITKNREAAEVLFLLQKVSILNLMDRQDKYSTWLEIDLNAIGHNIRLLRRRSGVQVMAIVKGNAYGHGAVPVARAALRAGATWLGVARIGEALELRNHGLDCPILSLGFTPYGRISDAIAHQISMTVWSEDQIQSISDTAQQIGTSARVHLKVDTGMSRLGIQPTWAIDLAQAILEAPSVTFEGLMTHFARADERDQSPTKVQEEIFGKVLHDLESAGIRLPLIHAANSAASLMSPTTCFDMVRTGISIYGLHPSKECQLPDGFRPALSWKTVLSQVKLLSPGQGVSYGHAYITKSHELIGTIPVGYADGFRRVAGNQVLVQGQRVPVIGQVCMDQIMVQLDSVPNARAGDEVVLIGFQGDKQVTADEVADRWQTINYEVVCGISSRVPRTYLNHPDRLCLPRD